MGTNKKKYLFYCEFCGYETIKWMGKCPRCGNWDTMRPHKEEEEEIERRRPTLIEGEVEGEERIILGIEEMDRVLGGGLVVGSSILLGGDPGIGKTTLCFQIVSRVVDLGLDVLYVSGEESLKQLYLRKKRLGLKGNFPVLITSNVDDLLEALNEKDYKLVIVDSVQAIFNPKIPMIQGSIGQIKDVSSRLIREMKKREIAHILIGHVTKEGLIAGPKLLEHMVDTVLYFEGEKMLPYRILRATKNRFGAADEIGIFQMKKEGLVSVENPSEFFLSEETSGNGTVFPYITGTRPILLEIQALVPKTYFSVPKRVSLGYDLNRLFILLAVMEKHVNLPFYDRDVYVNITGGIKVDEPAVDLAVVSSVFLSYKNISIGKEAAFFGEIGLTGEVRKVANYEARIRECKRNGIKRIFCHGGIEHVEGIEVFPVRNIKQLSETLLRF